MLTHVVAPLRIFLPEPVKLKFWLHREPLRRLWGKPRRSALREVLEVVIFLAAVTLIGWYSPLNYRALGHVYLLAVIALSLRVGRWPVMLAAVLSALAWNYVFIPPRLSFSVLHFEDGLTLGTYFVVALIAGQLMARIRAQEIEERTRKRQVTALFHLTRAFAAARTLDDAAKTALDQADSLFSARTALLLKDSSNRLVVHPSSSLRLNASERQLAENTDAEGKSEPIAVSFEGATGVYIPLWRENRLVGGFAIALPANQPTLPREQVELIEMFAAQIALFIEREQLRAAGEREKLLAESERLHRTLLDSVSHELKTPMAVLRSASEGLDVLDTSRRAVLSSEIRVATQRLDRLVANLLSQTRLTAGAVKVHLDWCDAREVIASARKGMGDSLAGRPVQVQVPDDMPLFRADAVLMDQILTNLLINACVHTPAGTAITIRSGVREATSEIFLQVSDKGPGLPAEVRKHLFQKFRRGHAASVGGVGLGLSIVRGFMLAQGGDVSAANADDGGAVFTLVLPLHQHGGVPQE